MTRKNIIRFFSPVVLLLSGWAILVSFHKKEVFELTTEIRMPGYFNANDAEGWTAHSSYLKIVGDSVQFELIMFRELPQGVNWHSNSLVGTISGNYPPGEQRVLEYQELPRVWRITIEPDGKCFFQLLDGPDPVGQTIVIPVITKYKK